MYAYVRILGGEKKKVLETSSLFELYKHSFKPYVPSSTKDFSATTLYGRIEVASDGVQWMAKYRIIAMRETKKEFDDLQKQGRLPRSTPAKYEAGQKSQELLSLFERSEELKKDRDSKKSSRIAMANANKGLVGKYLAAAKAKEEALSSQQKERNASPTDAQTSGTGENFQSDSLLFSEKVNAIAATIGQEVVEGCSSNLSENADAGSSAGPSNASTSDSFGSPAAINNDLSKPTSSAFGLGTSQSTVTPSSLFGGPSAAQRAFGTASTSDSFGSPAAINNDLSKPTSSAFGLGTSQSTVTPSSLFSGPTAAQRAFGNPNTIHSIRTPSLLFGGQMSNSGSHVDDCLKEILENHREFHEWMSKTDDKLDRIMKVVMDLSKGGAQEGNINIIHDAVTLDDPTENCLPIASGHVNLGGPKTVSRSWAEKVVSSNNKLSWKVKMLVDKLFEDKLKENPAPRYFLELPTKDQTAEDTLFPEDCVTGICNFINIVNQQMAQIEIGRQKHILYKKTTNVAEREEKLAMIEATVLSTVINLTVLDIRRLLSKQLYALRPKDNKKTGKGKESTSKDNVPNPPENTKDEPPRKKARSESDVESGEDETSEFEVNV